MGAMLAGRRTYSLGDFIEKTAKAPINKAVASVTPYVKTPIEIFQGKAWWPDFFAPRDLRDPISHAFRPFALDQEVNMVRRWMGSPVPSKGVLDRLIRLAAYADHPDQIALTASRARAYKFLADNRTSNSHLYNALYLGILYQDKNLCQSRGRGPGGCRGEKGEYRPGNQPTLAYQRVAARPP